MAAWGNAALQSGKVSRQGIGTDTYHFFDDAVAVAQCLTKSGAGHEIIKDNDRFCLCDKAALTSAIKRMGVIASDQTHRIKMSFNTGMLKFSVTTPDLGEASDELPINYNGDQLDIGFNATYLLEILRYMPTEQVRLTFKAPERAATIEPEGWDDPAKYLCLVMPLRLMD